MAKYIIIGFRVDNEEKLISNSNVSVYLADAVVFIKPYML